MNEFRVLMNGMDYGWGDIRYKIFNGGEVNLRLPEFLVNMDFEEVYDIDVIARLQCSHNVMALCMLVDALKQHMCGEVTYRLHLAYVPYARQDRVCNPGEALAIKVFAGIINSLEFDEVVIADPHSDVTSALINNVSILTQSYILNHTDIVQGSDVLISPDAGATKKTEEVSKAYGGKPVVQGFKHRDLTTGALSGFGVYDPDGLLLGAKCLIVDDIADGGGTFLGLASVLRDKGAESVDLYVTHGIFSQGAEKLLDNGIDHIYTTDSFTSGEEHERLTVVNL